MDMTEDLFSAKLAKVADIRKIYLYNAELIAMSNVIADLIYKRLL